MAGVSKTKLAVVRRRGSTVEEPPITAEELLVTPEMALEWLTEKNKRNRAIRPTRLRQYVDDINRDRWARTGETIKFDPNGNLLDGQHRLQAIFDTGKAQLCLVAYDVPSSSFMHIDTGAVRQGGDVLSIAGYDSPKTLAAASRYACHLQRVDAGELGYASIGKIRMPNDQLLEWVGKHPDIAQTLSIANSSAARTVMSPPSLFRALYWYLMQVDENDASAFFEALGSGVGLVDGDPVLVLRNALVSERSKAARANTRPYWYYAAVTIKAWNAFREGRPIKQLRFATGGVNRETWPKPK